MGGEYTAMATQTLETIDEVAKATNRTFDEVIADIVQQHFDTISIHEEHKGQVKEAVVPAVTQAFRPK